MGLLDAILGNNSGGGLLNGWQYPTSAPDASDEKKKQDAAFLAAINQDPNIGGFNPGQPNPAFSGSPLAGISSGQYGGSSPFGLGGANLPAQPQGVPASGVFPAIPPQQPPQMGAPQQMPPQSPPMQQPVAPQRPINNMPVGNNYQMPQFGSAADYAQRPMSSPTDVSSQSRQPEQPLPPALGGNAPTNPFLHGLQSVARGGGIISALTGNYNDPQSMQQQNLKAQYDATRQALIANGVSNQQASSTAMLAVMNPEAAKTILPELLTNKEKYQVISEDPLAGKQYGFVNDREQTVNGKPIGSQGAPASQGMQATNDSIAQAKAQGATREQLLQLVPSSYRPYVDAVLQDKALPVNMGRGAARMQVMGLAHAVDNNFNEEMIPARVAMRKDFAGEGKNGQAIGALNTVQHHADQVSDAIEGFQKAGGGSDYPILNAGKLMLANNTSFDPKLRDSAQQLKDKLNATEHEVASAYNAGHLSDHDLKTWNEIKAENLPIGQLKQKLADFVDLLNGKRDSLNHMYRNTFGEDAPAIDKTANESTTAKIHQRMPNYTSSSGGLPSGWSVKVH